MLETIALSLPWMYFLLGEFLQSQQCYHQSILCTGTRLPDFLAHSLTYDIVFLRAGYLAHNSHWFSQLLLFMIYFIALFGTRDAEFSWIFTVFFGVFHEAFWSSFEFIYNENNVYGGQSPFWITILSVLCIAAVLIYYKFFFHYSFLIVIAGYVAYLEAWWIFAGLHETVIYGGLSIFYYNFAVNAWEVGSYAVLFCLLSAYLLTHKYYALRLRTRKPEVKSEIGRND
jgi:hypothetical protein